MPGGLLMFVGTSVPGAARAAVGAGVRPDKKVAGDTHTYKKNQIFPYGAHNTPVYPKYERF